MSGRMNASERYSRLLPSDRGQRTGTMKAALVRKGEGMMKRQIAAVMCSAVLGFMASSSLAVAQQKTAKACQEEWRANKAANQANGVTEKAYVAQCRGGTAPTAAPATPAAPSPAPTAAAPPVRPSAP